MVHIKKQTAKDLIIILEELASFFHNYHGITKKDMRRMLRELKKALKNASPSSR